MPLQSDNLLNTVKQGSQLYKESSEATSGLAAKAGLPQTPSAPMETAVIGGTPSQAKMAGTPAAMRGQAKKIQLPTSLLLATQQRRQQEDPALTQAQEQAAQLSQRMQGLGSLGSRTADMVTNAINTAVNGITVTTQLDESKLPANLNSAQKAEATNALKTLTEPTTDANKQAQMDAAAKAANLLGVTPDKLTADFLKDFFKTGEASMNQAISAASLKQVNLGDLQGGAATLGYSDWNSLATDLGITIPAGKSAEDVMSKMTVAELSEVVDTVKRRDFQTQQEWMAVLQDPTSSSSDRSVARTMLRQMGASGVREAEESVAQLTQQVQAANRVTINLTGTPQSVDIKDVLTNDNLKAAVKILLNPDDAAFEAVKKANPQLADWVLDNKQKLQKITLDVSQDATDLVNLNAKNASVFKLDNLDTKTQDAIGKALYPDDWGKISSKQYDLTKSPLLASWSQIPAAARANLGAALSAVADGGSAQDMTDFLNTTRDGLHALGLDTQAGLDQFKAVWAEQKLIRSIGAATDSSSAFYDFTGMNKDQYNALKAENDALASAGISTGVTLQIDPLTSLPGRQTMQSILTNKLPQTIKQAVDAATNKLATLAQSADPVTQGIAVAIIQNKGPLSPANVTQLAQDLASKPDAAKNLQILQQKFPNTNISSFISVAQTEEFNLNIPSGVPKLHEILAAPSRISAEQAQNYLNIYQNLSNKVPAGLRKTYDDAIKELNYILNRKKAADADAEQAAVIAGSQRAHERSFPVITSGQNVSRGWKRLTEKGRW